ncbi:MAG TPA: MFS transporter [Caulobacteraceae bacterium]
MAGITDAGAEPVPEAAAKPVFSRAYLGWLLGLLVAIYACSFLDRVIISTVAPAIIAELRLSDTQFGLLAGPAFAIFYAAFGIPIARLAERSSRVNIIAICIALWSLMTALCGVTAAYWQLLIFRMGVGVGEGGSSPAAHSLLSDHYPRERRATALAVYSAGVPFGIMLGAAIGGWIADTFSWRLAFIVLGLPGLVLALLTRLTLKEPIRGHVEGVVPALRPPSFGAVCKRLGSNPTVVLLICGLVCANFGGSSMSAFTQTYLVRAFHLSMAAVGLLYGMVVGTAGIVGMIAGGVIADWAGKKDVRWYAWAPALGCAVAFPVYFTAYSQGSVGSAFGLIFSGYLIMSFYFAPTFAVVQNLVEPRMRASASALLFLAINLVGQGLGPVVMGYLSDASARHAFTLGNYRSLCPPAPHAPHEVVAACARASTQGLQHSILIVCGFYLVGAIFYLLASRNLKRDFAMKPGA